MIKSRQKEREGVYTWPIEAEDCELRDKQDKPANSQVSIHRIGKSLRNSRR